MRHTHFSVHVSSAMQLVDSLIFSSPWHVSSPRSSSQSTPLQSDLHITHSRLTQFLFSLVHKAWMCTVYISQNLWLSLQIFSSGYSSVSERRESRSGYLIPYLGTSWSPIPGRVKRCIWTIYIEAARFPAMNRRNIFKRWGKKRHNIKLNIVFVSHEVPENCRLGSGSYNAD